MSGLTVMHFGFFIIFHQTRRNQSVPCSMLLEETRLRALTCSPFRMSGRNHSVVYFNAKGHINLIIVQDGASKPDPQKSSNRCGVSHLPYYCNSWPSKRDRQGSLRRSQMENFDGAFQDRSSIRTSIKHFDPVQVHSMVRIFVNLASIQLELESTLLMLWCFLCLSLRLRASAPPAFSLRILRSSHLHPLSFHGSAIYMPLISLLVSTSLWPFPSP